MSKAELFDTWTADQRRAHGKAAELLVKFWQRRQAKEGSGHA